MSSSRRDDELGRTSTPRERPPVARFLHGLAQSPPDWMQPGLGLSERRVRRHTRRPSPPQHRDIQQLRASSSEKSRISSPHSFGVAEQFAVHQFVPHFRWLVARRPYSSELRPWTVLQFVTDPRLRWAVDSPPNGVTREVRANFLTVQPELGSLDARATIKM